MNPSIDSAAALETLVTEMTTRMALLVRTLGAQMQQTPQTLADVEQVVLPQIRDLAVTLVGGLARVAAPTAPAPRLPCPCGQQARYQRLRTATVTTIVGPITLPRAYYWCSTCHHGFAPLDATLQIAAGSRSAGLDELLALLGATHDSFADAAAVLERLTLVHVCPNSVRAATETLGALLVADQAAAAERHQICAPVAAVPTTPRPRIARLYISMDGIQTHLRPSGWSEMKVGCVYQTDTHPHRQRPEHVQLRMQQPSYCAALVEASTFGRHIWSDAVRRGVLQAEQVVIVGDGAHWIWAIAETQFAGATQILDWYHARSYIWNAATTIWSSESPERMAWVRTQLERLWEGQIAAVLTELERQQAHGEAVRNALIYYTNQRSRMDYPTYRARGLQIGSGSIESACKQLVTTRLKLAGMIWNANGAENVATVRAWLKSGRWAEAMALRPHRQRTYARAHPSAAEACPAADVPSTKVPAPVPPALSTGQSALPIPLRERSQAELAAERANHPWRKPWSVRQQRKQHTERTAGQATA